MTKPLPSAFLDRLSAFLSEPEFRAVLAGFSADRPSSFRINPLKSDAATVEAELVKKGIPFEKYEPIPGAYLIPKESEYALKGTDAYYGGKIYVQGLSSMVPAMFLDLKPGSRVLDACAAPGSKTTQIAAMLKGGGEIVALEKHQIRYDKLAHNCKLQGATNVRTVKTDALAYLVHGMNGSFDAALLDAPCSAEGRIRADDERTFGFWTEKNVLEKAAAQSELLSMAFKSLNAGGSLVYATCTLAPEENEAVVSALLAEFPSAVLEPCELDVPEARKGLSGFRGMKFPAEISRTLRILPSYWFEGFYVAKIRKRA